MPDIEVVGSGFVPGIPGVWGNITIPNEKEKSAPGAANTDASGPSPIPSEQDTPSSDTPAQEASLTTTPPSVSKSSAIDIKRVS